MSDRNHRAVLLVPVADIRVDDRYAHVFPPLSDQEFDHLCQSIEQSGILVPLCLSRQGDRYTLLDGHHRLRAATRLNHTYVPCVVAQNQEDEINMRYAANLRRRQLAPDEAARISDEYTNELALLQKSDATHNQGRSMLDALVSLSDLDTLPPALIEANKDTLQAVGSRLMALAGTPPATPPASAAVSPEAASPEAERLRAQVVELQGRMDQAEKLCRKLLAERDDLQAAVELYESQNLEHRQDAVDAAVKHANKEILELRRRLGETSQTLKKAMEEKEKLQDELQRAKEREDMWLNTERKVMADEMEVLHEENEKLRALLKTADKAAVLLRSIAGSVKELAALLDHTQEPWTDAERKSVQEAYDGLVQQWDELKEPLSLALGGLPPGRSTFDRMFPDKRHRQPLEQFLAKQQEAAANGVSSNGTEGAGAASSNGRKRHKAKRPPADDELDTLVQPIGFGDADRERFKAQLRREFGPDADQFLEPDEEIQRLLSSDDGHSVAG